MGTTAEERNKTFVLDAFDSLADRRDFLAARWFWSHDYIQHSAHIPPGRDGLIAEHWDVVQDEATAKESKSGLPMFGDTFPTRA
jgi:predicted SnoaL-like aldol condensation-catalyzing enzyme